MSDIALNGDHDLDVTGQALSLVEDVEGDPAAIAQEMSIAMQLHRGEWFLNTLAGIPYLTQVFIKNPNPSIAALTVLFTRAARLVPGITDVEDMSVVFDNTDRLLSVDYRSIAQDGTPIEDAVEFVL